MSLDLIIIIIIIIIVIVISDVYISHWPRYKKYKKRYDNLSEEVFSKIKKLADKYPKLYTRNFIIWRANFSTYYIQRAHDTNSIHRIEDYSLKDIVVILEELLESYKL